MPEPTEIMGPTRVLLPIKDSCDAERAVRLIQDMPHTGDWQYLLLHVVPNFYDRNLSDSSLQVRQYIGDQEFSMLDAQSFLTETACHLTDKYPELNVTTQVLTGEPSAAIVETARKWEAARILLTSRHPPSVWDSFRSCVCHTILQKAETTVVVVKLPESAGEPGDNG